MAKDPVAVVPLSRIRQGDRHHGFLWWSVWWCRGRFPAQRLFILLIRSRHFFFNIFNGLACIHPFIVQCAVDIKDMIDPFYTEAAAFKPDRIYTGITQWVTACLYIREERLWLPVNLRQQNECALSSTNWCTAHIPARMAHSPIVTCPATCVVAYNHIIANKNSRCKMRISHNKAILPSTVFPVSGTPVYCNKLPDGGIITNKYIGIFSMKFKVLRNGGYHCAGEYLAVLPDPCPSITVTFELIHVPSQSPHPGEQ